MQTTTKKLAKKNVTEKYYVRKMNKAYSSVLAIYETVEKNFLHDSPVTLSRHRIDSLSNDELLPRVDDFLLSQRWGLGFGINLICLYLMQITVSLVHGRSTQLNEETIREYQQLEKDFIERLQTIQKKWDEANSETDKKYGERFKQFQ